MPPKEHRARNTPTKAAPRSRRLAPTGKQFIEVKERGASYKKTLPRPKLVQVVDFFAGCGGMSWGFAQTRQSGLAYDVLAGLDIDTHALATYGHNLEAKPVEQDIRDIASRPELLAELVDGFDPTERPFVFLGCPPCQGFSAHRKKDLRDDPRNNLIREFARVCVHWRPDVVVIENVPEMLRGRYEHYYREAKSLLENAGYQIAEDVLDLSQYGVPQKRRRSIVIAALNCLPTLPAPPLAAADTRTVREAIGHLQPQNAGETNADDPWHQSPTHTPRILDLIRSIPPDGGDRRALRTEQQLDCHRDLDASGTPGFSDVYGRLRWDTPSVTITAKSSTPSCGRFLHPDQHRNISVREAALIQGFPHNYVFDGPFVNQYRQIGEAVPPQFSKHLAFHVLDLLRPSPEAVQTVLTHIARFDPEPGLNAAKVPATHRFVDLFCGAGGLSLGLAAAGLEHGLGVDLDEDAVATYSKNVSSDVLCADINNPSVQEEIERVCGDKPFVIAGGPPCQGFSQQRRGEDSDERNDLVLAYANLVRSLSAAPSAVILENVMYLDSPRGRAVYKRFVSELESMGYTVHRHDLNSADFGVAQLRRRIVIVALRQEVAARYSGPMPLTAERYLTVGEALNGLATVPDLNIPNHIAAKEQDINTRRIAFVDMGRGRLAIPEWLQLDCHRDHDGHLDVYGRLDWFSQARTITGGFDSASRGEYAHPFRNRSITAREAARIQGFPDWFEFQGNKAAVRRQIGNAVPAPMAFAVGRAFLDATSVSGDGESSS